MKNPVPAKLIKAQDFDREFTRLLEVGECTHVEAFLQLNEIYRNAFGADRYSDYDSYRVARRRRIKAKR